MASTTNAYAAQYHQYRMRRPGPPHESIMPANLWHGIWRGRQMVKWIHYGPVQPPQADVTHLKAPLNPRDGVTPGRP